MKNHIPAYIEITCDRCQHRITDSRGTTLKGQETDFCSNNMKDLGGVSFELDLCISCTYDFKAFLKEKKEKAK